MKQIIVQVEYTRTVGMLIEVPDDHQIGGHGSGVRIREEPGDGQGGTWITPTMAVNSGLAKVIQVL